MKRFRVQAGCCFCQECLYVCPVSAIAMDAQGAHIDEEKCVGCGQCANNCASEAIAEVEILEGKAK